MTFTPALVGKVDNNNSTTTPLASGATYTGTFTSVVRYGSVVVSGSSDISGGELTIQFSTDGITVDLTESILVSTTSFTLSSNVKTEFARVVYKNTSASAQTTFNLQTILKAPGVGIGGGGSMGQSVLNNGQIDVFGRLRTAEPVTLFDSKFQTDRNLTEWDEITSGTGSIVHNNEFPFIELIVGAGNGKVVRQTRRYHTYQPGKAFEILVTGTLEASGGVANVKSRLGLFDDSVDKTDATVSDFGQSNGFFFELDGTTLSVVQVSSITGVIVETRVNQADFNVDKLDGTGPSGFNIDVSKRQIFSIALEWLGVGAAVMGVYNDDTGIPCHVFRHANINSTLPYTNRGSLPIRYDIEATGSVSSATQVQICCTAISSGGFSPRGKIFSTSNELTEIDNITSSLPPEPILALRLDKTKCARSTINPFEINILSIVNGNIYYVVYRILAPANPFAVATWNDVNSNYSCAQVAKNNSGGSALTWAGGFPNDTDTIRITEGYISNDTDVGLQALTDRLVAVSDIVGVSDIILIAMAGVNSTSEDVLTSITWQEYD